MEEEDHVTEETAFVQEDVIAVIKEVRARTPRDFFPVYTT